MVMKQKLLDYFFHKFYTYLSWEIFLLPIWVAKCIIYFFFFSSTFFACPDSVMHGHIRIMRCYAEETRKISKFWPYANFCILILKHTKYPQKYSNLDNNYDSSCVFPEGRGSRKIGIFRYYDAVLRWFSWSRAFFIYGDRCLKFLSI